MKSIFAKFGYCIALILTLLLAGCPSPNTTTKTASPETKPASLIMLSSDTYLGIPQISSSPSGTLPAVVDMSDQFPVPGNQGIQGSCTAWAVAYYKSYQEALDHNWSVKSHSFSPSFIYNQINGGRNVGTNFKDALDLVVKQGGALLADMSYSETDWITQPTDTIRELAKPHVAKGYGRLATGDIRAELAGGNPVLIAVEVHPDFDSLSKDNDTYDSYDGLSRGNHAITLIGYDDNKKVYKFINSWGTGSESGNWGYGLGGYGYISYSLVDNHVTQLFVMTDIIESAALASITVTTLPTKTAYTLGEVFTSEGMDITAYYSDGTNRIVHGWISSTPDMNQTGSQTVTVTYAENGVTKTTSFGINIATQAATLSSISITTMPSKLTYVVGETFSATGMVVTATYSNAASHTVSGSTSSPNMGSIGSQSVTVTYSENGITRTASFNITLTEQVATLSSISILSPPTKITYKVGDTFSTAGMVVNASYSDSSSHSVGGWTVSSPNMGSSGVQGVTVTYFENGIIKTTSFSITIAQIVSLSSVAITTQPSKMTYMVGEAFSTVGMVVTASYSDSSSRSVSGWYTSSPNMGSAGTQSITVTYSENGVTQNTSFNITIANASPQLTTISVNSDKAEDVIYGQYGITFTLRIYDQSGNPMDISDTSITFSPLGEVQVKRLGVGSYSYILKSTTPTTVNSAYFAKSGIQSNAISYKFFKWAIVQPLPFTSGSTNPVNIMKISDIYLNWIWVPVILVEKQSGSAFVNGGRVSLNLGTYPSGVETSYRVNSGSSTTSVELEFSQPGSYYVTSGSMYVGMFSIVKKYQ
jgi:hypothetical protein